MTDLALDPRSNRFMSFLFDRIASQSSNAHDAVVFANVGVDDVIIEVS